MSADPKRSRIDLPRAPHARRLRADRSPNRMHCHKRPPILRPASIRGHHTRPPLPKETGPADTPTPRPPCSGVDPRCDTRARYSHDLDARCPPDPAPLCVTGISGLRMPATQRRFHVRARTNPGATLLVMHQPRPEYAHRRAGFTTLGDTGMTRSGRMATIAPT